MKCFRLLLIVALAAVPRPVMASEGMRLMGHCKVGDVDLDIYPGGSNTLTVVGRREHKLSTQLPVRVVDGRLHLPASLGLHDLDPADCEGSGATIKPAAFFEPERVPMDMCEYFSPTNNWDDFMKLLESGSRDIIPLKVKVLCTLDEDSRQSSRPCSKIELLSEKIEIMHDNSECSLRPQGQK
jgi:hypothetical protein